MTTHHTDPHRTDPHRTDPHHTDPHHTAPVYQAGAPLGQSPVALLMLHGRGASAADILSLAAEFNRPDLTYLAPQALGNTWYPYPFLAPLAQNEPYLSSALATVARVIQQAGDAGIAPSNIVLIGFSQGACLATEFAARHATRYGGVVGLSGGLIGPPGTPRAYPGSLADTPVILGCSDRDPHIPLARVEETATVLDGLGAAVTKRIYPGLGHTVNQDEINLIQALLTQLAPAA